ncbi:MAG: hypothetical protein JKY37_29865 [Nannocystaceae bacterium]|nr:hypothetical protein [Nannocystaceae bacterium]
MIFSVTGGCDTPAAKPASATAKADKAKADAKTADAKPGTAKSADKSAGDEPSDVDKPDVQPATDIPSDAVATAGTPHAFDALTGERASTVLKELGYKVTKTKEMEKQLGMTNTTVSFKKGGKVYSLSIFRAEDPANAYLDGMAKKTDNETGVRGGSTIVLVRSMGKTAERQVIIDALGKL